MYGTLWQAKLASHNNDTIMATDVNELVDVFVFLIVCSVSARDLNAIEIHQDQNISRKKWKTTFLS